MFTQFTKCCPAGKNKVSAKGACVPFYLYSVSRSASPPACHTRDCRPDDRRLAADHFWSYVKTILLFFSITFAVELAKVSAHRNSTAKLLTSVQTKLGLSCFLSFPASKQESRELKSEFNNRTRRARVYTHMPH